MFEIRATDMQSIYPSMCLFVHASGLAHQALAVLIFHVLCCCNHQLGRFHVEVI